MRRFQSKIVVTQLLPVKLVTEILSRIYFLGAIKLCCKGKCSVYICERSCNPV